MYNAPNNLHREKIIDKHRRPAAARSTGTTITKNASRPSRLCALRTRRCSRRIRLSHLLHPPRHAHVNRPRIRGSRLWHPPLHPLHVHRHRRVLLVPILSHHLHLLLCLHLRLSLRLCLSLSLLLSLLLLLTLTLKLLLLHLRLLTLLLLLRVTSLVLLREHSVLTVNHGAKLLTVCRMLGDIKLILSLVHRVCEGLLLLCVLLLLLSLLLRLLLLVLLLLLLLFRRLKLGRNRINLGLGSS